MLCCFSAFTGGPCPPCPVQRRLLLAPSEPKPVQAHASKKLLTCHRNQCQAGKRSLKRSHPHPLSPAQLARSVLPLPNWDHTPVSGAHNSTCCSTNSIHNVRCTTLRHHPNTRLVKDLAATAKPKQNNWSINRAYSGSLPPKKATACTAQTCTSPQLGGRTRAVNLSGEQQERPRARMGTPELKNGNSVQ